MIEIDEIISNAEFCANEYKKFSEIAPERSLTFKKYEEDHRQLAEWLKDYKRLKEQELNEDWHDTPSGEMTLEQARQAVRELRKYVMDKIEPCKMREATQKEREGIEQYIDSIAEPCEDCINRQVVKEQMIKYGFHASDMTVTEFVEDLPSVTPQPKMKIGKWIIMDIEDCELFMAKCSECGVIVDSRMISKYLYCHYCGAKMVEPQERIDEK